jgi:hypothetical protein
MRATGARGGYHTWPRGIESPARPCRRHARTVWTTSDPVRYFGGITEPGDCFSAPGVGEEEEIS